jgi:hypothetical protein
LQSSIQSGSISVVVADPESVQLGADAQPLGWRHASDFRALNALGIGMAGEQTDASLHP